MSPPTVEGGRAINRREPLGLGMLPNTRLTQYYDTQFRRNTCFNHPIPLCPNRPETR